MKTTIWMAVLGLLLTAAVNNVKAGEDWGKKFPNYEKLGERKVEYQAVSRFTR